MLTDTQLDKEVAKAEKTTKAHKLTPAQIYFAELITHGHNSTEAFVKSHPQSKSVLTNNRNACAVAANKLKHSPPLLSYIKSLTRSPIDSKTLQTALSRDSKRAILSEIIQSSSFDPMVRLRAMEIDNKLAGHEAPRATVSLSPSVSMADKVLQSFAQIGEEKGERNVTPIMEAHTAISSPTLPISHTAQSISIPTISISNDPSISSPDVPVSGTPVALQA